MNKSHRDIKPKFDRYNPEKSIRKYGGEWEEVWLDHNSEACITKEVAEKRIKNALREYEQI